MTIIPDYITVYKHKRESSSWKNDYINFSDKVTVWPKNKTVLFKTEGWLSANSEIPEKLKWVKEKNLSLLEYGYCHTTTDDGAYLGFVFKKKKDALLFKIRW